MQRREFLRGLALGTGAAALSSTPFSLLKASEEDASLKERLSAFSSTDLEKIVQEHREEYASKYEHWLPIPLFAELQRRVSNEKALQKESFRALVHFDRPYRFDLEVGPQIYDDIGTSWQEIDFASLANRFSGPEQERIREERILPNLHNINPELTELLFELQPGLSCNLDQLLHKALVEGSLKSDPGESNKGARGPLQVLPETYEEIRKTKKFKELQDSVKKLPFVNPEAKNYAIAGVVYINRAAQELQLKELKTSNPTDWIALNISYIAGSGGLMQYKKSRAWKDVEEYIGLTLGLYNEGDWHIHQTIHSFLPNPFPRFKRPELLSS